MRGMCVMVDIAAQTRLWSKLIRLGASQARYTHEPSSSWHTLENAGRVKLFIRTFKFTMSYL